MYTAITGLSSMGEAMSVIGNNIANVNTIGFKKSKSYFMDVLSQSTHTMAGASQIGMGVSLGSVFNIFSQGAFQNSDEATDLAISGEGFFIVNKPDTEELYYTRAGNFSLDNEGRLVTPLGYIVQGWVLDEDGERSDTTTGITLQTNLDATSTSTATFIFNLNSEATSKSSELWAVWDATEDDPMPTNAYEYQSSIKTYDSLGGAHDLIVYFDLEYNPPQAALTTDLGVVGGNEDLAFTAVNGGSSGNDIVIIYEDPGADNGGATTASVTGSTITVTLGHDGTGITATAQDVLDAIEASSDASDLVEVELASGNDGSGIVTAMAASNLLGGSDINTTPNEWEYIICCDPNEDYRTIDGQDVAGTKYAGLLMRGYITFDPTTGEIANTNNAITASELTSISPAVTWSDTDGDPTTDLDPNNNGYFTLQANFINGGTDQEIEIDFGAYNQFGLGNWESEGLSTTQFTSQSTTVYQAQNGYSYGSLQSLNVDDDGIIYGTYSNGRIIGTHQLSLASFRNKWALNKEGLNLYSETYKSGQATETEVGSGGIGTIHSNALEQSNVDLAQEFVDMIVIQRGFQANSKIITTTDTMLGELIQLKR